MISSRARVSHEAIYQWVYAQPVSTLARELITLRTGRRARRGGPAHRRRRGSASRATSRSAPPRPMPGHWEGDLVIGKDGKSAVATLVERMSRFLILVPLTGRDAARCSAARGSAAPAGVGARRGGPAARSAR